MGTTNKEGGLGRTHIQLRVKFDKMNLLLNRKKSPSGIGGCYRSFSRWGKGHLPGAPQQPAVDGRYCKESVKVLR